MTHIDESFEPISTDTRRLAEGAPRATLITRLWFAWFALVACLLTIPSSILQVITHPFNPSARNFKLWSGLWGRGILGAGGLRVVLEERTPLDPGQPYVFVANHQNSLDILAFAAKLPVPFGFVAKAELARVPMLGFAIRNSASIFIDRSDPRRSLESIQKAGERIRDGNSVLIYPEGARSYSPQLGPFKKGGFILAVEAGVPVVPVTITNAYRFLDERRYAGRPGTIRVVVGEPIPMADRRRRDVPMIMAAVRTQMERALVPECGLEARNSPSVMP